jgi:hypothetical protein
MGQILFHHRISLRLELVEHGLHVHGIPDDHRIGHQVETHRLIGLGLLLFAANDAFIRHEEKIAQGMQGFPFVEVGIDASAIVFTLEIAENKERFDQAAIFLQGTGEDVLSGWSVLDTHDSLTDYYKHLRSEAQIEQSLRACGFSRVQVWRGGNGVEARAS